MMGAMTDTADAYIARQLERLRAVVPTPWAPEAEPHLRALVLASDFATEHPTSREPTSPGPCVTAIPSRSARRTFASASAFSAGEGAGGVGTKAMTAFAPCVTADAPPRAPKPPAAG